MLKYIPVSRNFDSIPMTVIESTNALCLGGLGSGLVGVDLLAVLVL